EVAAVLEGEGWEVLGPVVHGQGERLLVRTDRSRGAELSAVLRRLQAGRSARKAPAVRVEVDPRQLV
ncbi:MAG: hypothetical protein JWL64_2604, partial [Frankiales bacterium]|nr:hypothetical protein [Frankiales bacterium]